MDLPKKGLYRHFKGKPYELIGFARHSETTEMMVIYRALYGEGETWVRPLSMWSEKIERDGVTYTRFVPEEEYLERIALSGNEDCAQRKETLPGNETYELGELQETHHFESDQRTKHQVLKQVYGYDCFREGQEEVIDSILSGKDTLAILPTGAGKSICYQIPAQMLRGVALVISPLISLMKDQVNALSQAGVAAAYLNSSLTERQFESALSRMRQGKYRIVYVAPERLLTQRFLNVVEKLTISMVAVDEAHCISQWGQDFRPSYLEIPAFLEKLSSRPKLCAFTATATQRVKADIIHLLRMNEPFVKVTGFNRPNLYLSVTYTHEKEKKLQELLKSYRGFSGIIYCATRKTVESVHEKLLKKGYSVTRYHAGLTEEERHRNQDDFIYDRAPLIVATNAFGMGIDKSDVRFVIHYNMPKDLESYYQEAGRAGRDGERADCHLLYEPRDVALQNFFIDKMGEESELDPDSLMKVQENARFRLRVMADYCRTTQCLRRMILRYFGETEHERCDYCANCLKPRDMTDVTEAAKLFVRFVESRNNRFGLRMIMDALRGSESEKLNSTSLVKSDYYGALKGLSLNNVHFLADALIEEDVLSVSGGEYPLIKCGVYAEEVLSGEKRIFAFQEEVTSRKAVVTSQQNLPEDIDHKLFEELRGVRLHISKSRSIPPYVVCTDAALVDMCRKLPTEKDQMIFVKGMGERKVSAYGAKFAKTIREYLLKMK